MTDSEDSIGTETGRIRNLTEKGKKLPSTITRGPKVVRSAIVEKTAEQNNKSHRGFDKFRSLKERKNVSGDKDGKWQIKSCTTCWKEITMRRKKH